MSPKEEMMGRMVGEDSLMVGEDSCPHTIGGLPCPSELLPTLESCVAAPTRGVNDLTIVGSPRGSSATWAEVNASVSSGFDQH